MRRPPVWLAIVAAGVPMFMATLDNLVVTTALPVIHRDLSAGIDDLQWITNAYTLAFASLMLFAVDLGDRLGRRRLFVGGIVLFSLASAACALATSPLQLILARAAEGVGAAAVMPLSLPLLIAAVPDRVRALAIGVWGGIAGLGVALGPVIGGAIVQGWTWSAIFWLNVPVGVLGVVLAFAALPPATRVRTGTDLVGVVLASGGLVGAVWGIVRGNEAGWSSAEVLGSLAGGGALLVAFVLWERRARTPLLPLRLFRIRTFAVANAVALVFSFGTFGAVFVLSQFLQIVQGATPLAAGVATMPWTLAPMVVAPLSGLLVPRIGTRTLITTGLLALGLGIGWLGVAMTDTVAYGVLLPGFVLAGVGMGLVFSPVSTALLADVAAVDHAKATGANSTLREVGTALGIAVLTAVFTGAGGTLTPTGFTAAAQPAVLVGAAAVLGAAGVALLLPRRAARAARVPVPAVA